MKYSININQAGIADAGLADKTDIVDWAIIDYIFSWQCHPKATKIGAMAWINYQHLITEMPLLGLKAKQSVSNRISKLKLLGLIAVEYDKDKRLYACLSDKAHGVINFRESRPSNNGGVLFEEHPVPFQEHPVLQEGHSAVNHLAVNQEQREIAQPKITVEPKTTLTKAKANTGGTRLPTDWVLSQDLGDWALAEGLTRERIRQEADKFRDYWISKPGSAGRKADWPATWRNWIRKATTGETGGGVRSVRGNSLADSLTDTSWAR